MAASPDPPIPSAPAEPVAAQPLHVQPSLSVFSYRGQTEQGLRLNGTIEATDGGAAARLLEAMHLRVVEVEAAAGDRETRRLSDDAFLTFNQQLAQFARSGMPVERGLRMIGAGLRRGAFASAVATIAGELKSGVPLREAIDRHRRHFPPLYGRLIDAAAREGDVAAVLLNLGRRREMQQRLASTLWRSLAYPVTTLCALLIVLAFIGAVVMPRIKPLLDDRHVKLPELTEAVFWFGGIAPWLAGVVVGLVLAGLIARLVLRAKGSGWVSDRLLLAIPIVGPVLRFNLIARWLDAVRISLLAGLDLPGGIELAGDVTASRTLRADGAALAAALAAGAGSGAKTRLLPAPVKTALEATATQGDLAGTLQTLCDLYDRQAELRLERIPSLLIPIMVILIAVLIGTVILGLLLPLISVLQGITNYI